MKTHHYQTELNWIGNRGKGTASYTSYSRDYEITAANKKVTIPGSSDPSFRGNPESYNPEELLVASLSSCHMLWYLHLCSVNNISVVSYIDKAEGTMQETKEGSGRFNRVTLKPKIIITSDSDIEKAHKLHEEANRLCFIANSCNFEIAHKEEISLEV